MHIETLVELAIQQAVRKSLRGLADQMGVTSAVLSQWKQGNKPIPPDRIRQLAKIANQDPGPWLLLIQAEQEGGDLGREYMKIFKKIGGLALAAVGAVLAWKLGGLTGDVLFGATYYTAALPLAASPSIHYAKCSGRRPLRGGRASGRGWHTSCWWQPTL